jgi:signal transduction histidine kinase
MKMDWNKEEHSLYDQLIVDQMTTGCHWIIFMAMTLFPTFFLTDIYNYKYATTELVIFRILVTALFALLFVFRKKINLTKTKPFLTAVILLSLCAAFIVGMCNLTGGFKSEYYAGINLCVLAALLLPLEAKRMIKIFLIINIIYIVGIGIKHSPATQLGAFLNNITFLIGTGVISVIAAHLSDKLRRESFQAQRTTLLKDEFIALASHELNTPLTSLNLQTQMAVKKIAEDKHSKEMTEKLVKTYSTQLKKIIKTVDDLLHISQFQREKLELEYTTINLVPFIHEVVEISKQKIQHDCIIINIEAKKQVEGRWDAFRVEQLLVHLITNAVKFSEGKPITVVIDSNAKWTTIEIIDQGIGISPVDHQRVFQKFERAVSRHEFSGLGLGLFIASQMARAHGGHIKIESDLGKGSKFSVFLPL